MSRKNSDHDNPITESRGEEQRPARRKLLKSIAIGGGAAALGKTLPEQWSKPVVDSVLVPAHAQATQQPQRSLVALNLETTSISDFFMQTAHASIPLCELPRQFCVERNAGVATFNILGGSNSTAFTEGAAFGITVGGFALTGVTISGNSIAGNINCDPAPPMSIATPFSGTFENGTCADARVFGP
jgi:hypothetical protein